MGDKYTVDEAFKLLENYGITSNIAVVRRWIRSGEIRAVMENKQAGYRIEAKEIQRFIEERSLQYWRNKALELERENKELKVTLSNIEEQKNVSRGTMSNITQGDIGELEVMKRDELRKLCKEKGITGYSRMTKEEMAKAIIERGGIDE